MKNIKLIFAALASFAAFSCEKEPLFESAPETNQDEGLVPLVLTTGEATKTHIAANGTDIHWDQGDQIKVFTNVARTGTNGYSYDFSMPEKFTPDGNFAKFEGKVAITTSTVWAVYPSELAKNATTSGVLTVNLPATQTAFNGETSSFNKNLNISAAKATVELEYELGDVLTQRPVASETMTFHNVCALLKFNIPAGITNISSVTISTNTDIVGDMTIDYSGNAPVFDGITANGSNSITMTGTFTGGSDYYFVLAPVAISELSIFVNTTDNKQYAATQKFSTPLQLNAGEYKSIGKLNINNMPSFGVDFDIQDDNGYLNGTDVVFTFSSDNVSNINLTVKKGTTTVRSINIPGAVTLDGSNRYISSCLNETSWPYLPKGTYTVSGTYETEDGTASVNNMTFVIGTDPNFTVGSFDAYTSYTKYTSGTNTAVADANACDGASIYIEQIGGISENIYNNGNYADCFKAKFNGSETQITASYHSEVGKNRFSMPAYGHYDSVVLVFDGVASSSSATIDCDVTGLPYVLNPAKNDGWTTSGNVDWNQSGSVRLGYNLDNWLADGTASIQKNFYAPDNIKVYLTTSGTAVGTGSGSRLNPYKNTTFKIEMSGSTGYVYTTTTGEKSQNFEVTNAESVMAKNNALVKCSNSYCTSRACSKIQTLTIRYRNN